MADDEKVTRIRRGKGKEAGVEEEGAVAHVATKYVKAPELSALADKLIPSPGLALTHLLGAKVAYEFTTAKQIGCGGFGSASLWPAWARPWGKYDFRIMVSRPQFDSASERQKMAAMAHLLTHLDQSERGVWTLAPHDYEDFGTVAARFGAWYEGGKVVAEQLRMFDTRGRADTFSGDATGNGHSQAAE